MKGLGMLQLFVAVILIPFLIYIVGNFFGSGFIMTPLQDVSRQMETAEQQQPPGLGGEEFTSNCYDNALSLEIKAFIVDNMGVAKAFPSFSEKINYGVGGKAGLKNKYGSSVCEFMSAYAITYMDDDFQDCKRCLLRYIEIERYCKNDLTDPQPIYEDNRQCIACETRRRIEKYCHGTASLEVCNIEAGGICPT